MRSSPPPRRLPPPNHTPIAPAGPWEHVLAAGFFAYLANRTSTLSDFLGERLDAGVMEQLKQNQARTETRSALPRPCC